MTEFHFELKTYRRFPITITKGEGAYIFTDTGKKILDLYGGHAVSSTGHCHPHVVKAIKEQVEKIIFYSNIVDIPIRNESIKLLGDILPDNLNSIFFVNSGSEANDNAIKIARRATGRKKILSLSDSYHGRTLAALSVTGLSGYQRAIDPMQEERTIIPSGDRNRLAQELKTKQYAGIILEPIQSMGGLIQHHRDYLLDVISLGSQTGTKVIFDEVQTGMGRMGRYFFSNDPDLCPDIMTTAKGLASGVPMGAVVVSKDIASSIDYGDLGSTFGGAPLACAALKATIEVIQQESLLENVTETRGYLDNKLKEISCIKEIRGEGFLMGLKFDGSAKPVQKFLLDNNILTGLSADPEILRLMPPLNLTITEASQLVQVLHKYSESI